MPWNIVQNDERCPASKPFAVIGGRTGNALFGCHPDKDSARKQQQALYAQEDDGRGAGLTPGKTGERAGGTGMPAPAPPASSPPTIAW